MCCQKGGEASGRFARQLHRTERFGQRQLRLGRFGEARGSDTAVLEGELRVAYLGEMLDELDADRYILRLGGHTLPESTRHVIAVAGVDCVRDLAVDGGGVRWRRYRDDPRGLNLAHAAGKAS